MSDPGIGFWLYVEVFIMFDSDVVATSDPNVVTMEDADVEPISDPILMLSQFDVVEMSRQILTSHFG